MSNFLKDNNRPRLSYRSNPNLANMLVRAKLRLTNLANRKNCCQIDGEITKLANIKYNHDIGVKINTTRCQHQNCPLRGRLICTNQVRSRISKTTYLTQGTAKVAYFIQCRKCKRQYVGQTCQSIRERFKKHIQAIRDCSHHGVLQEHFRTGNCASRNLDNITVQILHVVDSRVVTLVAERELKAIETLWIDRLMSQYPQGLNTLRYDPNECHQLP